MEPAAKPTARSASAFSVATRKEEAMWLLERLVPESAANNLALAFQVDGKLDAPALHNAVTILCNRYEVLRTVYFATGAELVKSVVAADEFSVGISEFDDFSAAPEEMDRALRPFVTRRFVLDGRPLVRAGLFHHPDGDVVCLAFHHLVYDIISGTVLLEELLAAYESAVAGRPPTGELLTEVPAFHEPEPSSASLDFWRGRMADFDPSSLDLWCTAPDSADPTLKGDQVTHSLSPEAVAVVKRLPLEVRAPEAVVLLAAFDLLLAAHGAGPDITVGSPVSVRPREAPRTVGHHTNVLPLRVLVDPADSFRTLVRKARDTYFAALSHADVPVDSVSELVPRAGASWRNRLCRHLFNYFPQLTEAEFEVSGQRVRPVVVESGYSKFDLEFFVASSADAVRITARYATEKLDEDGVRALLLRYEALLLSFGEDVDRPTGGLRIWNDQDRAVIEAANDTARAFDPPNVVEAVRRHALDTPDAVAVRQGDASVTYAGLWRSAVRVRDLLVTSEVGPGDVVALAAARSASLTAAVLGTWLAGAAYLPVDPEHPAHRVAYLLSDSGAKVVLTDRDLSWPVDEDVVALTLPPVAEAAADLPEIDVPSRIDPGSPAYLIYTSGSTGRPKGAVIPHRAVSNIAADYTVRLRATARDATLWMTTFAFDMANLEHYVPLYSGGHIVVAPDEARTDGAVLRDLIERHDPGIVQATPTTVRLVLDQVADRLAGRRVVIGAEPVPVPLAERLLATGCEVHHAYGPTETTTWCTWGVLPARLGGRLDIGVPIWNTRVMVLGPDGRELPIGVSGEVCIAGDGVALGYHGRPDLNAERFGEHPVYGRYYRSGDLGRWRPDGSLELFGRADRQVKLRGNRIELGEIEATLLAHAGVRAAAAVVVGDRSADGRLVAFVEAATDGRDLTDELWEHARSELPRSAIPQDFVVLESLPTNANEKVDYPALEALATGRAGTPAVPGHGVEQGAERAAGAEPGEEADELVRTLMGLWQQLLGRDEVTPESNFFTSGGHSLLGAQLVQRIEEAVGVPLKLGDLFAAPTPVALAAHIRSAGGS